MSGVYCEVSPGGTTYADYTMAYPLCCVLGVQPLGDKCLVILTEAGLITVVMSE